MGAAKSQTAAVAVPVEAVSVYALCDRQAPAEGTPRLFVISLSGIPLLSEQDVEPIPCCSGTGWECQAEGATEENT